MQYLGKIIGLLLTISVIGIVIILVLVYAIDLTEDETSQVNDTLIIPSSVPSPATPTIPISPLDVPSNTDLSPNQKEDVVFDFKVASISGSGLSRTVAAELKNTGTTDAHNVSGKVQVFSKDSLIKIGGKESVSVDIGTIAAGETITTEVILSFGLTDGLKISQNGAEVVIDINSDELTDTFSYQYTP